jgi:outer membrane protein assembly factor BamA
VSFRVIPAGGAHDLMFDLTEGDRDVLGVGVRYDTPEGVALLASASVEDWLSPGSTASISARLGSDQQLDVRDVLGAGPNAHFTQTYRATFSRIGLPRFRSATGQKEPLLDVREVAGEIDRRLSPSAAAGIELAHAWSEDGAPDADPEWQLQRQSFTTLAGNVHVDTYDKSVAATRGYSIFWRSEVAVHDRGAASAFSRQVLDAQGVYSFGPVLTALARIDAGYASGADVPDHKKFLIGGSVPSAVWPTQFIPFLGLPPQSRVGTAIQVLGGGLQARLPDQIVATMRGNIGNVFDSWPRGVHRNGYEAGGGITLSTVLPPGPLSLTVASRGIRLDPIIEISFGSLF